MSYITRVYILIFIYVHTIFSRHVAGPHMGITGCIAAFANILGKWLHGSLQATTL